MARPKIEVAPSARSMCVACKIPNGLALQLQTPMPRIVSGKDGDEKVTFNVKGGKVYYVHGPAYLNGGVPKGYPKAPMVEGGYAITRGIPVEFWEKWAKQNELAEYFVPPDGCEHGAIFAYPDLDDVVSAAREQEKYLTGMEPLSTDVDKNGSLTDKRIPRPLNAGMQKISPEPYPTSEGGATSITQPA